MIFAFQERFPGLSVLWEKYTAMQERREFPARTILLQEGKIAQNYYFVERGCLRVWFDNHGKDITFQFFFENEGLASLESFVNNIPSIFTIETIEPTTVLVLRKSHFEFLSRLRDTPQQRYANLLKERPHIVRRVPQHYIASYLGITPVHLSRIRNKLTQSDKRPPI